MPDSIKLLVVDDSKFIRGAVSRMFESNSRLQVVGEAANGLEALDLVEKLDPDVITLDVHMPVMDGISTLKRIMIRSPRPTVMLSNLTLEGAKLTFDTLKYGAVDFIPKPSHLSDIDTDEQCREITRRVRLAAGVAMESIRYLRTPGNGTGTRRSGVPLPCRYLFGVGASEGGYGALLKFIPALRADLPAAFLVVLYADPPYVDAFVSYLQECSTIAVQRAADGRRLTAGTCYLASGREYVTVHPVDGELTLAVNPCPFQSHRGAINMMMFSIAETMQRHSCGIVLTGSGEDGIEGVGEILRTGGRALVQDPASCLHKDTTRGVLARFRVDDVASDTMLAGAVNRFFDGVV
jgi:two-component system chemotaxis response regulator CheB